MSNILPVDSSYLLIKPIHASAELRYIKLATPEDSLLQWPYKSFFMPVSSLADAECIVLAARRSLFYIPLKVHVPVLSRLINIGNVEIFDENAIPTP